MFSFMFFLWKQRKEKDKRVCLGVPGIPKKSFGKKKDFF